MNNFYGKLIELFNVKDFNEQMVYILQYDVFILFFSLIMIQIELLILINYNVILEIFTLKKYFFFFFMFK